MMKMKFSMTRSTLLLLLLLITVGCQPVEKRTDQADVLKDIRDTTVIPDLGSYDDSIRRKSVDRIVVSLEKAPEITKTKRVICTILAEEGEKRALIPLTRMLAEGSQSEDELLETALLKFGEQGVPRIAAVLEEGSAIARRNAAGILLSIGGPLAHDALRMRLDIEKDPEVRFLCVCGLAQDARSNALVFLGTVLDDVDLEVRKAAWGGLSRRMRPPSSIRFDPAADPFIRGRQAQQVRRWIEGGDSTPL